MARKLRGATHKSPSAKSVVEPSLAPPVPLEGIPLEDRGEEGRALPSGEAPEGMDPAKWVLMNRAQRRLWKRDRG